MRSLQSLKIGAGEGGRTRALAAFLAGTAKQVLETTLARWGSWIRTAIFPIRRGLDAELSNIVIQKRLASGRHQSESPVRATRPARAP